MSQMMLCTSSQLSPKANIACAAPRSLLPHARQVTALASVARGLRRWQARAGGDGGTAPDLRDNEPSTSGRSPAETAEPELAPRFPARLLALLGAAGAAETGYLAWAKVFGGPVACPVSGSCNSVLNSDYAVTFGIPLSLLGLAGYACLTALSLKAATSSTPPSSLQRTAVLANSSVLAATSAYLVYILATQFPGDVCVWCLGSAATSTAIFITALRGLSSRQLGQAALPAGSAALAVIVALSIAWRDASGPGALADIDIPYQAAVIRNPSSSQAVALAKKLKDAGAKMYGAFWCSHCQEQKAEFGAQAQKDLPYVECYPQGYHQGTKIEPSCAAAGLTGFPSWVINGKQLSGEQTFEQLEAALAKQ